MTKGEDTRRAILSRALDSASTFGLEGLTIGELAKQAGMSKSGLYAHFASKENLQCQVLDAAAERFVDVIWPQVLMAPRGLPRLERLFDRWLHWDTEEMRGGCPFVAAAAEFDDREGPVHDRLVAYQDELFRTFGRTVELCIDEGHFRPDLDVRQFVFDFWGVLLSYHYFARLLRDGEARDKARQAFVTLTRQASPG